MGKLAPDGCTNLRHLLSWAEPVEPRHQRGLQARRHCQSRRWNGSSGLPRLAFALRFQHRLGHFLSEQGYAVCALDNILPDVRRQRIIAGDPVNQRGYFALC
jgi:hypothetical protein